MQPNQEARGAEQPAPAGGNTAAKGQATFTPEVERVGALLRGDKPKAKRPDAAAETTNGQGDQDAPDAAAREDTDKGGEAKPVAGRPEQGAARDGDGGEDRAPGGEGEAGEADRLTTAELARALGVKPGEIFEQLAVDVDLEDQAGGKSTASVTLGELRRGYIGAENLRQQRETYEQEREAQSLEAMQTRRYFERMAYTLAPYIPKDAISILERDRGERLERERALLYAAVPEWKDAAKHAADRTAMIDYLKPWGFTAADVAAIEDHRIARFVRDQMNAARRTRDAEDRARKAKQTGGASAESPTPGRGQQRPSGLAVRVRSIIEQGKAAKTHEQKVSAVADLLNAHASSSREQRRER